MTRLSKYLGGGTRCPECNGSGERQYCPPRWNGWCVRLGQCRRCQGYGYTPIPRPPKGQRR